MLSPIRHPNVICMLIFFIISVTTYMTVETKHTLESISLIIESLDTLDNCITEANQCLKYAALAPTEDLMHTEFNKMLVTRALATKQYEFLRHNKHMSAEDLAVVKTLELERVIYRQAQNTVVDAIKKGDRSSVWNCFMHYKVCRDKYTLRVRNLYANVVKQAELVKQNFYYGIFIEGIILIIVVIAFYFWDHYVIFRTKN